MSSQTKEINYSALDSTILAGGRLQYCKMQQVHTGDKKSLLNRKKQMEIKVKQS